MKTNDSLQDATFTFGDILQGGLSRRTFIGATLAAFATVTLPSVTGCSGSASADASVTTIAVAVANDFNPYAYLDDNGNYIGYEVDVLQKVDDLLPQYSFEYQTVSDQFVALTSNKVDLISHEWEKNDERAQTYLFGDELITTWANYIAVLGDRTDISSLADLVGKNVQAYQGGNDAYLLETYNASQPTNEQINIVYAQAGDFSITLSKIQSGAIDAFLTPPRILELENESYGTDLKTVGDAISNSNTYFIFRKDDDAEETLKEAVDGALASLRADGTLSALSIQWLGADYTVEQSVKLA